MAPGCQRKAGKGNKVVGELRLLTTTVTTKCKEIKRSTSCTNNCNTYTGTAATATASVSARRQFAMHKQQKQTKQKIQTICVHVARVCVCSSVCASICVHIDVLQVAQLRQVMPDKISPQSARQQAANRRQRTPSKFFRFFGKNFLASFFNAQSLRLKSLKSLVLKAEQLALV